MSNAALAARYEAIAYAALPHPLTHPDRLATVATFLGYDAPPPARCRVLEVGCNQGANLVPMAVTLPGASFVGCDLSQSAIDAGRAMAAAIGAPNVDLRCEDLATLDPALGPFDYIVAHGVYSWVPAGVRDALFSLAQARLAPNGAPSPTAATASSSTTTSRCPTTRCTSATSSRTRRAPGPRTSRRRSCTP